MLLSNVTKKIFKNNETCATLLCVISVKLDKQRLDDIIELFMDRLVYKDEDVHNNCAKSILKIALKLNERQLNKVFECLVNAFESRKITICNPVHTYLQRFYHNWEENSWVMHVSFIVFLHIFMIGEQLDDVFKYLVDYPMKKTIMIVENAQI
ncbi:hypothetical protein RFI_02685 [Reticulomyxa filosa]|uniref:Uncharacterized protein n=1 Tax=Reticulomyxa filosa TaxID=46433 RepID=X6P8N0_RETFI|nr:hypothetical protein RFI_02685 [Reticulomyxa filosa]|eukprot:ETO34409.1 hypothetical protein RFI_02685 [Reticulomyxa filosa]